MSDTAITKGVHHVGLTVPNIDETSRFFIDTLGFSKLGEVPEYPAVFVGDGTVMITLWQAADPATATQFDRKKNIGLHHLALAVETGKLEDVFKRVASAPGVESEFSPQQIGDMPLDHAIVTIPGGIRVEFTSAHG